MKNKRKKKVALLLSQSPHYIWRQDLCATLCRLTCWWPSTSVCTYWRLMAWSAPEEGSSSRLTKVRLQSRVLFSPQLHANDPTQSWPRLTEKNRARYPWRQRPKSTFVIRYKAKNPSHSGRREGGGRPESQSTGESSDLSEFEYEGWQLEALLPFR